MRLCSDEGGDEGRREEKEKKQWSEEERLRLWFGGHFHYR